jgi:hypothetical protein
LAHVLITLRSMLSAPTLTQSTLGGGLNDDDDGDDDGGD